MTLTGKAVPSFWEDIFYSCSVSELAEQYSLTQRQVKNMLSKAREEWQDAYRTIICDPENHLSDPYDLRSDFNGYVYLGIHDFDNNDIPELIVGDSVSIAIFTYSDGEAVKIADLYEPEYRGGINKLFYKNNTLLLVSNEADGNGYVCLTYDEGDYIKGFYDDHNPDTGIINENQVSKEDFEQLFIPDELMQNGSAIFSQKLFCIQLNIENKTVMVSDNITEMDGLDFNMIRW